MPYGHWKTLTFLAALRSDRIDAPCVLDQPFNAANFRAYIKQFLVPTLRPGDIVVMDNLSSQKDWRSVRPFAPRAPSCSFFRPTAQT